MSGADNKGSLDNRLEELRMNYVQQLPEKFSSIEQLWQQLGEPQVPEETVHELYRQVHCLVGSGTTFGLPEVSRTAGLLEQQIKRLLAADTRPASGDVKAISSEFNAFAEAVADAAGTG